MNESENIVSTNQISLILLISSISLKALLLPSLISNYAGNAVYFSMLIGFLFEFITLLAVIYILKEYPNKNFFRILQMCYGKVFAFIISVLYILYFSLKSVFVLSEARMFFVSTLYEEFSWILFAVPLFFVVLYIITKNIKVIGRLYEIFFILFIGALLLSLFTGVGESDITSLLPFCEKGIGGIFYGYGKNIFFFGDVTLLLAFCGKIKIEKDFSYKLKRNLIISMAIMTLFVAVYYCVFSNMSDMLRFAISSLMQYSPRIPNMGRLDWFIICVWCLVQILNFALAIWIQKTVINENFNLIKYNKIVCFVTTLIIFASTFIIYFNLDALFDLLQNNIVVVLFALFQHLFPIFTFIVLKIRKGKVAKLDEAKT